MIKENNQIYTSAIFKTHAGNLGWPLTRLQHSQIAQELCIINEIEVPRSEMNPGLMINHGDPNAFESLLFCPNGPS